MTITRALVLSGAIVVLATTPAFADEQPKQKTQEALAQSLTGEAKALYEMGRSLFDKGDVVAALSKFTHAHELSRDARLLWNVAACEASLKHWARAMTAVDRYLVSAGPLLTDKDREQATRFRSAALPLVAILKITTSPDPITVDIDSEPIGQSPFTSSEAIYVDAGAHRVRFTKPGYRGVVRSVDLAGGTSATWTITLERLRVSALAGAGP